MSDNHTFFGVYRGVCVDNNDPDDKNRIKLKVPQVLGDALSDWAWPVNPVTNNTNHPDHKKHLASEVASLLQAHATHATHSTTITSGSASAGTAHTHSVVISLAHDAHTNNHAGNSLELDHEHETDPDEDQKWNDDLETNTTAEHTPHRMVPDIEQGVWVMFEGGDPNFPLWIGVF